MWGHRISPSHQVTVTASPDRLAACHYRDFSGRSLGDFIVGGPIVGHLMVSRPAGNPTGDQFGAVLSEELPALENAVAIDGIELAQARSAAGLVRRDESRARTSKEIENDAATARDVLDRVHDHRDRLHRWVERKFVHTADL